MLRTTRCLKNASRSKCRNPRSLSRNQNRRVLSRPSSVNSQQCSSPILDHFEASEICERLQPKSETKINRTVLLDGVHSQLDDVLETHFKGFSSNIQYRTFHNAAKVSLLSIPQRNFSTSQSLYNEPIRLRDKFAPTVKSIPGKVRTGWKNYKSDLDMSKYEKWHWTLTPIKKLILYKLIVEKTGRMLKGAIVHTWVSMKLFWLNSKIGIKIGLRILKGETVSVIERNRLRRALSDIFLMLPFSVFIIIPGAELLIPVYVKIFPSAMPKAFESLNQKQQRQLKQAQYRLDLASFLHETLAEVTKKQKALSNPTMVEFMKFTKQVRQGNRWVTNSDFKKFAPLFQEELTIDKMERKTLDALCKIFKANPVKHRMVGAHGEFTQSTQLIRILLKKRLHELKYEDKDYLNIILKTKDGIKNIPDEDLQELCRDRGMRSAGLTRTRLEIQYSDWLELSADPKISDSMLAYTRMLYMPRAIPKMADVMEKVIDSKKLAKPAPKLVENTKVENEMEIEESFVDTAPLIEVDPEKERLGTRIAEMKMSLQDIEAILDSIAETKRILKPLAATQDELKNKIEKIGGYITSDKVELMSPSIIKKIEQISARATASVDSMPIETSDVAVRCTLLAGELRERKVTEYKIKKIIRVMDLDGDGQISLDELETYMNQIRIQLQNSKSDAVNFDEIMSASMKLPPIPPAPNATTESTGLPHLSYTKNQTIQV